MIDEDNEGDDMNLKLFDDIVNENGLEVIQNEPNFYDES